MALWPGHTPLGITGTPVFLPTLRSVFFPLPASLSRLPQTCCPLGSVLFCPHRPSSPSARLFLNQCLTIEPVLAWNVLCVYVAQDEVRLPIQLLQPPHAGMGYRCVPPHLGPDTASDAPAYPVSYQDVPASPLQTASSPSPAPSSAFPLLACILVNDVLGVPSSLSSRLACKHPPLPPFLAVPFSASVHLLFYLRLRAQAEFGCSTNGYDRFSTVRIPPLNCSFSLSNA